MENYTKRVDEYLLKLLPEEGYRLIKTEFVKEEGNYYLRAYIDFAEDEETKEKTEGAEGQTPEAMEPSDSSMEERAQSDGEVLEDGVGAGIGIDDCVKVSRKLSKWLDKEDFIKEAYTLEVCSRGFLNEDPDIRDKGEV